MKTKKVIKWIKLILKYFIPVVLGWIEGDTKVISDALSAFISLYLV